MWHVAVFSLLCTAALEGNRWILVTRFQCIHHKTVDNTPELTSLSLVLI